MSLLDDMRKAWGENKPVQYQGGQLSREDFRKVFDKLYENHEPRPIKIYTGLYGMYTFDYALAAESGMISEHMTKKHAKFIYLDGMGLHHAVDENGIRWMIGKVKGKGYHFTNMQQRMPKSRPKNDRFTIFELYLEKGWPTVRLSNNWTTEQYVNFTIKHNEKKEAKRTGIRRKGTLTPEEGAMRRGY